MIIWQKNALNWEKNKKKFKFWNSAILVPFLQVYLYTIQSSQCKQFKEKNYQIWMKNKHSIHLSNIQNFGNWVTFRPLFEIKWYNCLWSINNP